MKVAYIIAYKNFKDEEYFVPKEILEEVGIEVDTYSNEQGEARGVDGGDVEVDSIEDIKVNDYQGVAVAGGPGAVKYLDNDEMYSLLNEFREKGKLVSAICISPTILAKAGLLKGKKATVWFSNMDKSAIKVLKNNGAEYIQESVVSDGKIITANGPEAAKAFGKQIVISLSS
ncbi:MAG: DJ-1/PfpI family protein [Patescibacteria group bacterium]